MNDSDNLHQALLDWVHVSMRRSMHAFTSWVNRANLSKSQIGTLMRLYYHGGCPISSVGDGLGITAAAASQMVDRLVQQDLIQREEDPDDRRVKKITLTREGRTLVSQGVEARVNWLRGLEAAIPEDAQPEMVAMLKQLTQAALSLEEPSLESELSHIPG
jgi:DNA-binding MarR family transcriptional regulator